MVNSIKKHIDLYVMDLLGCLRKKWWHILLSLLFCIFGIVLGILERRVGNDIFVKIYGDNVYLIFVKISSAGSLFAIEFFPLIILLLLGLAAILVKWLYPLPDLLFLFYCYVKTISFVYLFVWGGIYGKIMAFLFCLPCFILHIIWYFTLKVCIIKNQPLLCRKKGRISLYHSTFNDLLLQLCAIIVIIIGEIVLLTILTAF